MILAGLYSVGKASSSMFEWMKLAFVCTVIPHKPEGAKSVKKGSGFNKHCMIKLLSEKRHLLETL